MQALADMACLACRAGAPTVSADELALFMPQAPGWQIVEREGMQRLEQVFKFHNFADSLAFTNRVGALAEAEGHHPALLTEWGRATVTWWTHSIGGLHRNDFILAARTDRLVAG